MGVFRLSVSAEFSATGAVCDAQVAEPLPRWLLQII